MKLYSNSSEYTYKLFLLTALLSGSLLLSGCNKSTNTNADNPQITILPATPTPFPENSISSQAVPTEAAPTPAPDTDNPDELTSEDAKALILERLDVTKYTVDLIDSALALKGKNYYSFLVSEGNHIIEPALIVDKQTGEIFCYDAAGQISDYSKFPLYNEALDAICDWNGSFQKYDSAGTITGSLLLGQGDSHSFEFTLSSKNGFEEDSITGVASIRGNTASFTSPEGVTLHFVMSDNALAITEERADTTAARYAGIYYLSAENPNLPVTLTKKQAIWLLSSLTMEQTGLPEELEQYQLITDDLTLKIKETLCYSIGVYTNPGEQKVLMNTYYVALDGSRIFTFDPKAGDDIVIWRKK